MNQFKIASPSGKDVFIPKEIESNDIYKSLNSADKIKTYYEENGYVVIRKCISEKLCDNSISTFKNEVLPYNGHIYRQASANLEKHVFTKGRHMLNSILNVQSLDPKSLNKFRNVGTEILTTQSVQNSLTAIFQDSPKLVQSMFFDGNPVTWAHQDTYYLDSEKFNMAGVWFAMEDIAPDAGRFYIYPESHKIDIKKNGGDFDIAFNHDKYKNLVVDIINKYKLELIAPALQKGDILIWHSKTIHGCLPTIDIKKSRKSFTGHYIPNSEKFLQYQTRIKPLNLNNVNGMNVNFPKDLNNFSSKVMFNFELYFPSLFKFIKNRAIKLVTK